MKTPNQLETQFRWFLRKWKPSIAKFIMPLLLFQGIRTLIFPSFFDVGILVVLLLLYAGIYYSWY